jgi:hypothetical protein
MPTSEQTNPLQNEIDRALARLKSSHEGASGIAEIAGFGRSAVSSLRALLFERDRSGLFHARYRAIEALVALRAFDVLAEFLLAERPICDAVERLGEDVVVSAAARALAVERKDWVYDLLRKLAARKVLNGILAGLGTFLRMESIPVFVRALAEDEVRLTAARILRQFGSAARLALLEAAIDRDASDGGESLLRKQRSALALLLELDVPSEIWPMLRPLTEDRDPEIALLARKAYAARNANRL